MRLRAAFVAVAISAVAFATAAPVARADDEAEARELFVEARHAFDAGHLPRARDLLRRSLALSPRRATAVNLARVLRATGDMVDAEGLIESLLEGHYGELDPADRTAMQALLEEVRRDIVTLTVELRGAAGGELRIDGVEVARLRAGRQHVSRLDAGPHVVNVTTEDGRRVEQRVDAARGEQIAVRLTVPSRARGGGDQVEVDGGGFWSTAWPWVGLAAIAIGGAVLLWAVTRPDAEPTTDPVWGHAEALRF